MNCSTKSVNIEQYCSSVVVLIASNNPHEFIGCISEDTKNLQKYMSSPYYGRLHSLTNRICKSTEVEPGPYQLVFRRVHPETSPVQLMKFIRSGVKNG
ncbi:MAG: hypothetical protein KAT38_06425 [Bacteroidales bacterium]|nr:hypothetical protein [Bacteroidales bacterium]